MNLISLPCTPEVFLARLKFATETDTVEKNQTSAKEAVFYSHAVDNVFELYERPAFTKDSMFVLGGMRLRGAVVEKEGGCEVATEIGRAPENIRYAIVCALLCILSLIGTVLSGNIFATMLPILVLLSGGYLIADAVQAVFRTQRLKKKWEVILSKTIPDVSGKKGGK